MVTNVFCVGEVLWDSLPSGLFLGGAPFNVACHLNMLGIKARIISRVGNDELGKKIIKKVRGRKLETNLIQVDDSYSTGIVDVNLDKKGNATYNIVNPAAWDFISLKNELDNFSIEPDVLIYGTLAQRNEVSRKSIKKLRAKSKLNVYDVNLRPPFTEREIINDSLLDAHIVKMNDEEFLQLSKWFNLSNSLKEGMRELADNFNCETICITKGAKGSAIYRNNQFLEHPGFSVDVKDTIGAGDAFLAALLHGFLHDTSNKKIIEFANAVGAYVASQDGAIPKLDMTRIG